MNKTDVIALLVVVFMYFVGVFVGRLEGGDYDRGYTDGASYVINEQLRHRDAYGFGYQIFIPEGVTVELDPDVFQQWEQTGGLGCVPNDEGVTECISETWTQFK